MTPQSAPTQTVHPSGVTRRRFVQWSAIAGASTGLLGVTACNRAETPSALVAPAAKGSAAKVVWSSCNVNCGSRCPLRLNVVGEVITRVDPDNTGDDNLGTQQIRACVRGRSIRQRIYNPDRLKKPMKRVGKRGEGKWAEISWDEAFTTIADNLKRLTKEHGNESIYINYGTGVLGATVARS